MALFGIRKPTIITDASAGLSRRSFITGASATLFVAPAIVRAASLMPVRNMVPLTLPDFVLCDGAIMHATDDPGMYAVIEAETNVQRSMSALPEYVKRRYGGSVEEQTFAMPDFTPFKRHFGDHIEFELDRKGDLYMRNALTGDREKL